MKTRYKLRLANKNDISNIEDLFREIVAEKRRLSQPDMVISEFLEDFVAETILKEEMLIVENSSNDIEMVGEIHHYQNHYTGNCKTGEIIEMAFFTNTASGAYETKAGLIDWLYKEISSKHDDVFRVELTTPVSCQKTLDLFNGMGISVNNDKDNKIRNGTPVMLPLVWDNPSFQ